MNLAMQQFDLSRYMGVWNEFARYDVSYEKGCQGARAEYSLRNNEVIIHNLCYKNGKIVKDIYGTGIEKKPGKRIGSLIIRFNIFATGGYNVLWTDYTHVSFVINDDRSAFWILVRDNELSGKVFERINSKFNYYKASGIIDESKLIYSENYRYTD